MKLFRTIAFGIFITFILLAVLDLFMSLKAKYYDEDSVTSELHISLGLAKIIIALIPTVLYFIACQMANGAYDFIS